MDVLVTCINESCGVPFKVPHHVEEQARRQPGRKVYCPNGHNFVYTVSTEQRLREQIADVERRLTDAEDGRARAWRLVAYWKGIAHRKRRT